MFAAGKGKKVVRNTHVAICGGMQQSVFEKYVTAPTSKNVGLTGRFFAPYIPMIDKTPAAARQHLLRFKANWVQQLETLDADCAACGAVTPNRQDIDEVGQHFQLCGHLVACFKLSASYSGMLHLC